MTAGFNPADHIFNQQNTSNNNIPDKSFISAIVRDKDASQFYINNTNISIQNSIINGSVISDK